MNLLCFAGLTAGALVCNLLNKKYHKIDSAEVRSVEHNYLKESREQGCEPYLKFNESFWNKKIEFISASCNMYYGTHCHPSVVKCLGKFENVINICITTKQSKFYRYLRYFYLRDYESVKVKNTKNLFGTGKLISDIDFIPNETCTNIEFENIVNGKFVDEYNLNKEYFNIWKLYNSFLYKDADPILLDNFDLTGVEYDLCSKN